MKPLFLCYSRCSTCSKAAKWLKNNNIDIEIRDIITDNPTKEELEAWIKSSGIAVNKFFNTSGVKYRELGVKNIIKTATEQELIELLASDGKLVKRPLLIIDNKIIIGFNEVEYNSILLK